MSDYDNEPRPAKPEVVNETVVVVGGRKAMSGAWGLVLAVGVVAVVFGILVLANIWGSVHLVAIFAGLFLLFAGILQFFIGGGGKTGRIVAGVVAIILGVALIAWPEASVKTVAIIIGLAFLISGVSVAVAAIAARGESYGAVVGLGAVVGIIGLVFIIWPGPTVAILMILVGLAALLFGIGAIIQALALRRALKA
jgi:uncharacterized membrane protein HdeD (DUF308 family)